jgi:hypothetical protein
MEELKKEFVPHDIALEMQSIGFDKPTICVFNSYEQLKGCIISSMNGDYIKKDKWDDRLPAPTFSQCFKWFRENYKLHSTITSISQESWQWHIQKTREPLGNLYDEDFYTYEEAELACLRKLIEIIKGLK